MVEDKVQESNWTREKENAGLACWEEALREEKGGASGYLQPTFHLAPGTQWRKCNLSLS